MNTTETNIPNSVKNPVMTLIPSVDMKLLRENYTKVTAGQAVRPVVKLFGGPLTWLVTDICPDGYLTGYADLNMGCVELGSLCHVSELPAMKCGPSFLERDRYWKDDPSVNYLDLDSLAGI